MACLYLVALAGARDADLFTVAQEAARGRHDALVAGEPRGDDDAGIGHAGDLHRAPLDACGQLTMST